MVRNQTLKNVCGIVQTLAEVYKTWLESLLSRAEQRQSAADPNVTASNEWLTGARAEELNSGSPVALSCIGSPSRHLPGSAETLSLSYGGVGGVGE